MHAGDASASAYAPPTPERGGARPPGGGQAPPAGSTTAPAGMAFDADLEQPLPDAIGGRDHGWLSRYRRYPTFSPAWARRRAITLGLLVSALATLTLGAAVWSAPGAKPLGAGLQMLLGIVAPLFAGPWLASLVRRRHWPLRREGWALAGVFAAVVLGVAAFNQWGAEPLKQRVAEAAGLLDENGQRPKVRLMVGIGVWDPVAERAANEQQAAGRCDGAPGAPCPEREGTNWAGHALVALSTFALAGGFALPRWRREHLALAALQREQELARARAARHDAELRLSVLAAQVEPHFLFNTLAGVRSALATDPARAAVMIDRLTEYLRAAIPRLRSDGGAEATLGGQLDIVRSYLALMSARMPRLTSSTKVADELLRLPFPPLMLISLAENAVKHGAEPKIGPVHIEVEAALTADGRLRVEVADNGAGFGGGAAQGGSGLGLANIRERLAHMHGPHAQLELRARPGGGVIASVTLPLEH